MSRHSLDLARKAELLTLGLPLSSNAVAILNEIAIELRRLHAFESTGAAKKCREQQVHAEDWDSSYWDQACESCANALTLKP